jgi:Polysaccharide biosynthesis enzyme WcbI
MSSAEPGLVVGASDPQPTSEGKKPPRRPVLPRLEKAAIGRRNTDGSVMVRRRERPGCLLYGPYWRLPAGVYRLEFRCRCGTPRMPGEAVLGVEVIAMNRFQLAWLDVTANELAGGADALEFSVPPALGLDATEDEARLEFRFFHMANADLTITEVALCGPEMREQAPPARLLWRMLGRLEPTVIAHWRAGRLTVRREHPAGCVLDGGNPLLQLPRGHYRLNFDCEAARVRRTANPVLGVEVIAHRRWQDGGRRWPPSLPVRLAKNGGTALAWRDFTAPELREAGGSIDFAVPTELALEGGQDIVLAFRFLHLENADLRIGAVELRQAQTPAASPMRWRLLGRLAKGSIGTQEPDGAVTVRRSEPPGRVLYGRRPQLALPQGRYRLSFCCRTGAARSAADPVLAIEVIARTRLSWFKTASSVQLHYDFTAEALAVGQAAVEFDVPLQLDGEGDGQVGLEFRVLHLGNAAFTIRALHLEKIAAPDEGSRSPAPSVIGTAAPNVLIIGNCQAQTVYEGLMRTGGFNRRLNVKYHFVGLQHNLHELGKVELESSDVLLVQDIKDWESYPLRQHIDEAVRIVKFPLLHFASLWPFDHYNGPGDKEAYDREWPNLTFLYQDGLLARLRREVPDREQRLAAYRSLSVDGVINFVRLHEFEKRRLVATDKQFALQIGEFILENFTRKQLFYTTNHPNAEIMTMLIQYLLRQLDIHEAYRPTAILDHLGRLQVPVHPKVAEALGVKWANENTRYCYGGEEITWETYVRRYIDHYG